MQNCNNETAAGGWPRLLISRALLTQGCPILRALCEGWEWECSHNGTNTCRIGGIATRPCKERKDGARTVVSLERKPKPQGWGHPPPLPVSYAPVLLRLSTRTFQGASRNWLMPDGLRGPLRIEAPSGLSFLVRQSAPISLSYPCRNRFPLHDILDGMCSSAMIGFDNGVVVLLAL
jgi:hypothetical protein